MVRRVGGGERWPGGWEGERGGQEGWRGERWPGGWEGERGGQEGGRGREVAQESERGRVMARRVGAREVVCVKGREV